MSITVTAKFEENVSRKSMNIGNAPETRTYTLSTDEYHFLVFVFERGQIPNEYSFWFAKTSSRHFNICKCKQIPTSINEYKRVLKK